MAQAAHPFSSALHPTAVQKIIGQEAALQTLTEGLLGSQAKHHAWLLTGPKGVGKATLTYHIILKLLSHGTGGDGVAMVPKDNIVVEKKSGAATIDDGADLFGGDLPAALPTDSQMDLQMDLQMDSPADASMNLSASSSMNLSASSLDKTTMTNDAATHSTATAFDADKELREQLRQRSHPHFLLLDKTLTDKTSDDNDGDDKTAGGRSGDSKKTQITVGMVRNITKFLSFHGFDKNLPRIVMIDGAEDMNAAAANALLKNLEEPPPRTIFFLISHRPGLLPATIRSRCFLLPINPLPQEKTSLALTQLLPMATPQEQQALLALAAGRLGRAVEIYNESGLNIYRDWLDFFTNPDDEKPARRKKFLTSLLAQENPPRAQLFLSMVEVFFLRLARYQSSNDTSNQSSNDTSTATTPAAELFSDEEKTFRLFLARRGLNDWLDFWQMQKLAFMRGFPPRNLNRDYLVLQLLDETDEALHGLLPV